MHPEVHWKLVADRQQEEAIQRMKQQQLYKQKLKRAYMAELSSQLKTNQQLKKREKSLQSWQEKQLIKMGVESNKKQIQNQIVRDKIIQEKQKRLQLESQKIMNAKRQHEAFTRQIEKDIEVRAIQAAQYAAALKRQQEQRKKDQLRKNYLDTIEYNRQYKSYSQKLEKNQQKNVLNEGESRKLKDEFERLRFYHNLRQRAKVVDYGSHRYFEQNTNKTLLDKKKEEWNTYKDFLELQQKLKSEEERSKQTKAYLQSKFRNELKIQMEENRLNNRLKAQEQVNMDKRNINYSQDLIHRAVQIQREQEQQRKREYGNFLREQAVLNKKNMEKQRQMKEDEMKINLDILGKQNNSSLDTFQLDFYRKKQLSVLQKSLKPNLNNTIDQMENSKLNYFANRGMNLIK